MGPSLGSLCGVPQNEHPEDPLDDIEELEDVIVPQNEHPEDPLDDIEELEDVIVPELRNPIEVFDAVLYPSPPAKVQFEFPRTEITVKETSLFSRERFLTLAISYPNLCTASSHIEVESSEVDDGSSHKRPSVEVLPMRSQSYQNIVVHAPPYPSIAFKITNAPIKKMDPDWDRHLRKYKILVYFGGPDEGPKYKVNIRG